VSSQISTLARLISVTHRDDIQPSLLAEGVNRWRLLAEWGAAPAGSAYATEPPGASGDTARPNYVGPSGNGLVERMKAGATVLRSKENAAVERREARRSALWTGNPVR
jgi:hypothetical protein